jgi:hypothetical protein
MHSYATSRGRQCSRESKYRRSHPSRLQSKVNLGTHRCRKGIKSSLTIRVPHGSDKSQLWWQEREFLCRQKKTTISTTSVFLGLLGASFGRDTHRRERHPCAEKAAFVEGVRRPVPETRRTQVKQNNTEKGIQNDSAQKGQHQRKRLARRSSTGAVPSGEHTHTQGPSLRYGVGSTD